MIYLKQAQLLNPAEVEGPVEELKYPFRAAAVRYIESIVFRKPVTFLVGENGAGKSTLLEGIMFKYEERDEDSQRSLEILFKRIAPMHPPHRRTETVRPFFLSGRIFL